MSGVVTRARCLVLAVAWVLSACVARVSRSSDSHAAGLVVTPAQATLMGAEHRTFVATSAGAVVPTVNWSVKEGDPGGTISSDGFYTAPANAGKYTVVAVEPVSGARGEASVTVVVLPPDVGGTRLSCGPGVGMTVALDTDLVLQGPANLEWKGGIGCPCTVEGNGHQVRTDASFTGTILINGCTLHNLGTSATRALDLTVQGAGGNLQILNTVFDATGAIAAAANSGAGLTVASTVYLDNGLVPMLYCDPTGSTSPWQLSGDSTVAKLFQGNRVFRGAVEFDNTLNWLIGGSSDVASNVISGKRGGILINSASGMVVRLNYIHADLTVSPDFPYWCQVTTFWSSNAPTTLVEHNVIQGAHWIARRLDGEMRYNLILDPHGHAWIGGFAANARVHHNIFSRYNFNELDKYPDVLIWPSDTGFYVYNEIQGIEFFNNVVDCADTGPSSNQWTSDLFAVSSTGFLSSLRSNVFTRCMLQMPAIGWEWWGEPDPTGTPSAARLGYADYNLFYDPDATVKVNYGITVAGKRVRVDAGFGLNDAPVGGAVNAQDDPRFVGPLPSTAPFSIADVVSGATKVTDLLSYFRTIYTPAPGSDLIDKGDPQDGPGVDIGAVGAGVASPDDKFGRP